MVIFNLPLMFLLAKYLDFRYRHLMTGCHPRSFISYFLHHLPMVIFLVLNAYIAYLAIPTYGTMAFLLNPFQTWSFLIAILLWKSISYIPESHFRHMYGIFPLPEQASHRDDLLSGNHHFDRSLQ